MDISSVHFKQESDVFASFKRKSCTITSKDENICSNLWNSVGEI